MSDSGISGYEYEATPCIRGPVDVIFGLRATSGRRLPMCLMNVEFFGDAYETRQRFT